MCCLTVCLDHQQAVILLSSPALTTRHWSDPSSTTGTLCKHGKHIVAVTAVGTGRHLTPCDSDTVHIVAVTAMAGMPLSACLCCSPVNMPAVAAIPVLIGAVQACATLPSALVLCPAATCTAVSKAARSYLACARQVPQATADHIARVPHHVAALGACIATLSLSCGDKQHVMAFYMEPLQLAIAGC